ncbi:MAG: purine-binding chemotaxis protein CheW [Deltaproteobacteria bacterium]|nr:purine-binding chemotaxis protein CheW [Deltaproteobacteria bacterium]
MSTLTNQPAVSEDLLTAEQQQQLLHTRARALARPRTRRTDTDSAALQVVEFLIGTDHYALDASVLREVTRMKEVTHIPGTPPHVVGVMNVRGLMVALIDLPLLLGLPRETTAERDRVLIIYSQGKEAGILTDGTLGMRALALDTIHPVPPMVTETRSAYLRGITSEQLVILDPDKILFGLAGSPLSGSPVKGGATM